MTQITVTGPGTIIAFEMIVIEKFLTELGYKVIVEDEYPYGSFPVGHTTKEQYLEFVKELLQQYPTEIKLTAVHLPWGG